MAEIKLYDYTAVIEDDWWGSYEVFYCIGQGDLSASVVAPKIEAVPDGEDITVKINSVGGYVFDGWSIYNALVAAKKRGSKIIVRVEGLAASIASVIAMAGDEVIICQAAMLMIHKPSVDPFWYGSMDAEDLKREASALDQIQAVLNNIYTSRTGLDTDVIDSMINAETWITPSQALMLGFATSIENTIIHSAASEMPENTFKHVFKNADAQTRAYANKTITVNKNIRIMDSKEVLQKNTAAMNKSNSLIEELKNVFTNIFGAKNEGEGNDAVEAVNQTTDLADGNKLYHDGELAVGVEVFADEAMTLHPEAGNHELSNGDTVSTDDGGLVTQIEKKVEETEAIAENSADLEVLRAENLALTTALNNATTTIEAQNETLTKLKNVKSNFTPEKRNQEINDKGKAGVVDNSKPDLSKEAREARRIEREQIKNSKNKK